MVVEGGKGHRYRVVLLVLLNMNTNHVVHVNFPRLTCFIISETMSCKKRKGGILRSLSLSLGRLMIGSNIDRVTAICRESRGGMS